MIIFRGEFITPERLSAFIYSHNKKVRPTGRDGTVLNEGRPFLLEDHQLATKQSTKSRQAVKRGGSLLRLGVGVGVENSLPKKVALLYLSL